MIWKIAKKEFFTEPDDIQVCCRGLSLFGFKEKYVFLPCDKPQGVIESGKL